MEPKIPILAGQNETMETDETFAKIYFRSFEIRGLAGRKFRFEPKKFIFVTFCLKNRRLRFFFASRS